MTLYHLDYRSGEGGPQRLNNFTADDAAARATAVAMVAQFAADPERLTAEGAMVVQVSDDTGRHVATVRLICSIV